MNYVCAVYAIVIAIIVIDWYARGKREFRGQAARHEEVEQSLAARLDADAKQQSA